MTWSQRSLKFGENGKRRKDDESDEELIQSSDESNKSVSALIHETDETNTTEWNATEIEDEESERKEQQPPTKKRCVSEPPPKELPLILPPIVIRDSPLRPQQPKEALLFKLPNELATQILTTSGLKPADQISLILSCLQFYRQKRPSLKELHRQVPPEQAWTLAEQLHWPVAGRYLCRGCKVSHPAPMFEPKEWRRESGPTRLCRGRTGVVTLLDGGSSDLTMDCVEKMVARRKRWPDKSNKTMVVASCRGQSGESEYDLLVVKNPRAIWFLTGLKTGLRGGSGQLFLELRETKSDGIGIVISTNVRLLFHWLFIFLRFCSKYTASEFYHRIWKKHLPQLGLHLCRHVRLSDIMVCRLTLETAQAWKDTELNEGDATEIQDKGDWAKTESFAERCAFCDVCGAAVFARVRGNAAAEANLEFEGVRWLGISATGEHWLRNITPRGHDEHHKANWHFL